MTVATLKEHYESKFNHLCKTMARPSGSPENAEDVVQEAYARALQYINAFNPERGPFEAWFNTILSRCLKDFKSDERAMGTSVSVDVVDEEMFSPEDDLLKHINAEELKRRIGNRGGVQGEVLSMYFVEQFTWNDISRVLDIKKNNIKQIIWRFKEGMREEIRRG